MKHPRNRGRWREAATELGRHVVAWLHTWRMRLSSDRVGCVLVYHGVADETGDVEREIVAAIGATRLKRHLDLLRRRYRVVAPSAIVDAVARRRWGDRFPLAITFDDDLASHVTHAAPLLRERRLPAAFFLCGSMLAGFDGYWWEYLQAAVDDGALRPGDVPATGDELVSAALAGRPGAISELARLCEELPADTRAEVTATLARHGSRTRRLEAGDVRDLVRDGFEVGFHTLRHDRLPPLGDAELSAALTDGRRDLEALVGVTLDTVSYPHGRGDARVAAAARASGFVLGFLGSGPPIRPSDELLLLSRHGPSFSTTGAMALGLARYLRGRAADG